MTIADDLTHDPDATAAEVASGSAGSALDRIKKRRNQVSDTLEVGIPSWGGELRAEFKILHRDRIDEMIRIVQQRARQMQLSGRGRDRKEMSRIGNETDMDFLIDACVGIWADPVDADQEREKLSDGFFDMTFVPQLDPKDADGNPVEIRDGREMLMYLLKWNTFALTTWSQKIARWMQDTSIPVEDPQ